MDIGEDYTEDVRHSMADFLVRLRYFVLISIVQFGITSVLISFQLRKHFRDFKSTHCTQLPAEYFNIPFDIPVEHGFVFT